MNEQEIKEMLERIAALESKNAALENKFISLEKQVDTINKFVSAITESQSIETAMNEIESVTRQLTSCDKATFYCYDNSGDKFFSHGDYRNWQDKQSAEELKKVFVGQKIQNNRKEAVIPLVTSRGKSLGVIVAEKESGFKKSDFEGFKKGSQMMNTVELALKKEFEHQGRITDELTNLKNRQGLNEYLKNTLCGNLNDGQPVSIVMCDIDHFKAVNDTYGHEAGDTILKGVAAVLNDWTRDGADCAFRMGGEEMVLVLNCAHEKAVDIAERLREQIENTAHTVMQGDTPTEVKVTVSMGVCDIRPNIHIELTPDNIRETFDADLASADRAAYNAKNNGRNQVDVYDPDIYKSYLAGKAAEILCGGNPETVPKIKDSIATCLESKNDEMFYSAIDALQDYAAKNPQVCKAADTLITKICKAYGYDTPDATNTEPANDKKERSAESDLSEYEIPASAVYDDTPSDTPAQQTERKNPTFYNKGEYGKIQNKTFIGTDAKTAYNISKYAEKNGVQFSAKFDGKNSAVTVDGVKNKGFIETVKSMSAWSDKVQIKAAKAKEQYQKPSQNTNRGAVDMEKYRIVSFSGGKDSTAMLLRLMELGEPINEVIWCDTYKEFPAMYRHVEKIKTVVEEAGIKFTELKSDVSFDYLMFEKPVKRKNKDINEKYNNPLGFSWAGPKLRWCTRALKVDVINKYLTHLHKQYDVVQYVGIAADELYRLERKANAEHIHPLVTWGWTEQTCLDYCYSKGYDWEGLYEHFDRVSCWCCPLQSLDNLRTLRKHFPDLWEELRQMDKRTWRNFRADYTIEQLEKRFALEDERIAQGLTVNPRCKDFREALKGALG